MTELIRIEKRNLSRLELTKHEDGSYRVTLYQVGQYWCHEVYLSHEEAEREYEEALTDDGLFM